MADSLSSLTDSHFLESGTHCFSSVLEAPSKHGDNGSPQWIRCRRSNIISLADRYQCQVRDINSSRSKDILSLHYAGVCSESSSLSDPRSLNTCTPGRKPHRSSRFCLRSACSTLPSQLALNLLPIGGLVCSDAPRVEGDARSDPRRRGECRASSLISEPCATSQGIRSRAITMSAVRNVAPTHLDPMVRDDGRSPGNRSDHAGGLHGRTLLLS